MAVLFDRQQGPGAARSAPLFGNASRVVVGSVDSAGSIADLWDKNKGGLTRVEVILFDRPGLTPDYGAKTVAAAAGATFPQRFVAFGR